MVIPPPFLRVRVASLVLVGTTVLTDLAAAARPDPLFDRPTVLQVALTLDPAAKASLESDPRAWVRASGRVDGREFPRLSVRLKGTTSFMKLGEKPSFTVDFARDGADGDLAGHRRIHLNNSAQDSSYLCDAIASELFREAGVPVARTAWAVVVLDGRSLGLFVVKEALDDAFLDRWFGRHDGNFYEGGLHQEIDGPLRLDSGKGAKEREDLKALMAAATEGEPAGRWDVLGRRLDFVRHVSMLAAETLSVHLDGYSAMHNNYRIHVDPRDGRAVFVVHGLDRMWEQPEWPVPIEPAAAVSRSVAATPEGRARVLERIRELMRGPFADDRIRSTVSNLVAVLASHEPLVVPQAAELERRILRRTEFVRRRIRALEEAAGAGKAGASGTPR